MNVGFPFLSGGRGRTRFELYELRELNFNTFNKRLKKLELCSHNAEKIDVYIKESTHRKTCLFQKTRSGNVR